MRNETRNIVIHAPLINAWRNFIIQKRGKKYFLVWLFAAGWHRKKFSPGRCAGNKAIFSFGLIAKATQLIEIWHLAVLHHSVRFSTMFLIPLPSLLFYSFSVLLVFNMKYIDWIIGFGKYSSFFTRDKK